MSMAQQFARPQSEFDSMPETIESPEGKLLYLYLATHGECEVGDIVARLDVPNITAYSVLGTLAGRGLVERTGPGQFTLA